jgi:calcineurin-like phosphoesterase family protein
MIYFTSDHHFGDHRMNLFPRYFENTDEMNKHLIDAWNDVVAPSDTVYYIGDFAYTEEAIKIAEKLHGTKHLIRGNHDEKFDKKLFEPYFDTVQDSMDMTIKHEGEKLDVHLVHYPHKGVSDKFNLVGRVHSVWKLQKNMLNVCTDCWHFRPITQEEILFFYNAICKYYDEDCWAYSFQSNLDHENRGKTSKTVKEYHIKLADLIWGNAYLPPKS